MKSALMRIVRAELIIARALITRKYANTQKKRKETKENEKDTNVICQKI